MKNFIGKVLFGKAPGPGRQIYLDYLRVLATIFVIGGHTVALATTMLPTDSIVYKILEICFFVCASANVFFFMLSGTLLLPVKNEKIGTFIGKRFSKVAVPLVVYYVLYACAKEGFMWLRPSYWKVMFLRIIGGPSAEAPHFWLIYAILGLYVLTPFLRWILHHISDEVLNGVIIVVFVVNALKTYLPIWGMDSHLSVITDSFVGLFLLGYFLNEKCSKRMEDFFIWGGILSFVLTACLIFRTNTFENYIYENAPTMMFFAAAIFLLVKRAGRGCTQEGLLVRLISKYSFSILLIHWGVLHFFVKQVLHVDVLSFGIIGGCLIMMVLTLFFSICGAILIDNTIIGLIQFVGHLILCGIKWIYKKVIPA